MTVIPKYSLLFDLTESGVKRRPDKYRQEPITVSIIKGEQPMGRQKHYPGTKRNMIYIPLTNRVLNGPNSFRSDLWPARLTLGP